MGKKLKACVKLCKYPVVKDCIQEAGFEHVEYEDNWNLLWMDTGVSIERLLSLKGYQKLNHFPGMQEICKKDLLAKNMAKLKKIGPNEYNFVPRTWIFPNDMLEFQMMLKTKKNGLREATGSTTFIAKPDKGCQGQGIFVFKTYSEFEAIKELQDKKFKEEYGKNDLVIQEYVPNPYLLDGFKFDLRIYVLITCVDPLEIYIYKEGLVRLATVKYEKPSDQNLYKSCMHLTNYAVNKDSEQFLVDESGAKGSKRSLSSLWDHLKIEGKDASLTWDSIKAIIVKTIITIQPQLKFQAQVGDNIGLVSLSRCFEILGFDILLDSDLKPWLLEVNHSPSFTCDTKLDYGIKHALIKDTIEFVSTDCRRLYKVASIGKAVSKSRTQLSDDSAKSSMEENLDQINEKHLPRVGQGYERIYPSSDEKQMEAYVVCFQHVQNISKNNKATINRQKHIKAKLEELDAEITKYQEFKAKHKETNLKYINKETRLRIEDRELTKVVKKIEKTSLERIPLKMNVTDLMFFPFD